MVERKRRKLAKESEGGLYFRGASPTLKFVSTGAALLDCVISGGLPLGRIVNIVGDKAVGKTLLAIEACANFARSYPKAPIWYAEVEAAFDKSYAEALGLPLKRVTFVNDERPEPIETVEAWYEDLNKRIKALPSGPALYILDSLDALSDSAEMERDMDKGTYGATKAKQLSQLFRRLVRVLERKQVCLIVISQIRDNIGVTFGRKYSRSGGRALDFYATTVMYLAYVEAIRKTIKGVQRPIGIRIKVKCEKNKIGWPMRECALDILFGYGIDDIGSNIDWLSDVKRLDLLKPSPAAGDLTKYVAACYKLEPSEFDACRETIAEAVRTAWGEIEARFQPARNKYGK